MHEYNSTALFLSNSALAEGQRLSVAPALVGIYPASEKIDSTGNVLQALDEETTYVQMLEAYNLGAKRLCIALTHSQINSQHEQRMAQIASYLDFENISLSHVLPPQSLRARLMKQLDLPKEQVTPIQDSWLLNWQQDPEILESDKRVLIEKSLWVKQRLERHFLIGESITLDLASAVNVRLAYCLTAQGQLTPLNLESSVILTTNDRLILSE